MMMMLMISMRYFFCFGGDSYSACNVEFIYLFIYLYIHLFICLSINIVEVMNVEAVVQCIRNTCSPQIQQQALVVMTTIAPLYPVGCSLHRDSSIGEIK